MHGGEAGLTLIEEADVAALAAAAPDWPYEYRPPRPVEFPPTARAVEGLAESDCRFPHGQPGQPGFRFCRAPASVGSSYCEEHARLCEAPGRRVVRVKWRVPRWG